MEDIALIVDDDQTVSAMLHKALESSGLCSEVVNSGEDALRLLACKRYDLILMDIYPAGSDRWLERNDHMVSKDALVIDCCGINRDI